MLTKKSVSLAMLLLSVCLTATSVVSGQASGGAFTGIVKDANGAVVPNASIAIKALATGVETAYKTTSEGVYQTASLTPGSYLLTVQVQGFKREVFGPVTLEVNQTVRVDFTLSVGELTQAVQVEATGAQLLQTESGEISQVIGSQQVSQLPLNGRNWQQLVGLVGGVALGSPGQTGSPNAFNINGQRDKGNNWSADGISTTAIGAGGGLGVPVDAIQEFSVLQNAFSAEYGNVAGGVINVQTKSGTNNWHGSAFEYLRNDKFDATNFFSNATGQPKNSLRYNQFGGSLGGPIRRDKTFIFGNYQGTRTRASNPFITTVPLAEQRQGDFSNFRDASGKAIPIYDPLSSASARTRFSHNGVPNVIPPNRINPAAGALLKLMPLPNQFDSAGRPLAFNNYAVTRKNSTSAESFGVRVDHNFSSKSNLFVRYFYGSSDSFTPSVFGPPLGGPAVGGSIGLAGTFPGRNQNVALSFNYIHRPNLISEFRFGLIRSFGELTQENVGKNLSEQFGIPGVNRDRDTSGLSSIDISGLFSLGDSILTPLRTAITSPSYSYKLRWTFGRQTISTGFDFAKENANVYFLLFPRGFYIFEPLMTGSLADLVSGNPHGSALASFMTGFPTAVVRDTLPGTVGERFPRYGIFFQDDIKATTRLTLSLGLRYDVLPPSTEIHNRQANFDPATRRMLLAGVDVEKRLRITDYRNIGPRIGIAYALTKDRKTVLRSGYGIAYVNSLRSPGPANGPEFNPPFRIQDTLTQFPLGIPALAITNLLPPLVIPSPGSPPRGDLRYLPPDDRNTYSQTWNFGIQHAVTSTMLAEVAYVGSKGTRLLSPVNINQAPPALTPTPGRRPFGGALGLIRSLSLQGNSSYQALQAK
ncbi:MAG: TonB-dependent receptor, partial [Acidobacteria bacterium]|nr:TonB-dependent receptor [Acidobacteriota bacterium]